VQPTGGKRRRLDEGKRTTKVERKEYEKKKLAEVPPTALQNNLSRWQQKGHKRFKRQWLMVCQPHRNDIYFYVTEYLGK
jgi:hypothetical protein